MILEIIATIISPFQSSLRQGIKLNPLYTLSTMINIFHDKFDKVSCAMMAKKPKTDIFPLHLGHFARRDVCASATESR